MEKQPGYHSTGRSAAYFAPAYGNEVVRTITRASESFFHKPPVNFSEAKLYYPRDSMFVAQESQRESMAKLLRENPQLLAMNADEMQEQVQILKPGALISGARDGGGGDLDVDAILQGFLRMFKSAGGDLKSNCNVQQLDYQHGSWHVQSASNTFKAPVVVNACGAWADNIALKANLQPLGIKPLRRTVVLVDSPRSIDISDWPLTIDVDENFYFKPEAGQLLISPADETPSVPCDAQPDEMDIAIVIDRVQQVTNLAVTKINHSWAGLRSFAPDKTFVTGFDPRTKGFFWLAGQGGYGVQTAPALADIATYLLTGSHDLVSREIIDSVVSEISPDRLI
jgi:D-arginine dehydrogenase